MLNGGSKSGGDSSLTPELLQVLKEMEGYTIMVHEFLYLLCNASNRLEQINLNHKVAHRS
jgi:hypothetical protein